MKRKSSEAGLRICYCTCDEIYNFVTGGIFVASYAQELAFSQITYDGPLQGVLSLKFELVGELGGIFLLSLPPQSR